VRDPNRKGTVENAIQHTQSTALKGRRFETIDEQNVFLEQWETKWAAPRIHGSAKRQVEAMFQERAHLGALPLQGFSYYTECERTVADDTCVRIDHSSYAARPAKIGSRVLVRLFERHVEIRDRLTLALLRTHPRAQRPGSVLLPDDERPFNPSRETRRILAQAGDIGDATLRLCQQWFEHEGRIGQRKLRGVGLARRYPRRLIDQACAQALQECPHLPVDQEFDGTPAGAGDGRDRRAAPGRTGPGAAPSTDPGGRRLRRPVHARGDRQRRH
jgi:hypothetical protein